jgi:hypothetical protein
VIDRCGPLTCGTRVARRPVSTLVCKILRFADSCDLLNKCWLWVALERIDRLLKRMACSVAGKPPALFSQDH